MDNLDVKYPLVRAMSEKIPPSIDIHMESVIDREIPGPAGQLRMRIYTPTKRNLDAPVIMYIHGGGFVLGSIAHVDRTVRLLARDTGAIIVSVEYGLAPESPYPAGLEDCKTEFDWIVTHANDVFGTDPARIAIGGDSAGGNLAIEVAIWRRDHKLIMPCALLLYSPLTGSTDPATGKPWPSRAEANKKTVLTKKSLASFERMYLGNPDIYLRDPTVNPVYETDLSLLPPTLITICGIDPLRDEDTYFANRLEEAGVTVVREIFPVQDHAWIGDEAIKATMAFIATLVP
jgi:acetyl esterase/lipase